MKWKILIMLSLVKSEILQNSCYKNQEDISSHYRQEDWYSKQILCENGLKKYFSDECFLIREWFCEHAALVNLFGTLLKLKAVWSDSWYVNYIHIERF